MGICCVAHFITCRSVLCNQLLRNSKDHGKIGEDMEIQGEDMEKQGEDTARQGEDKNVTFSENLNIPS
jgi:hypothetical protein